MAEIDRDVDLPAGYLHASPAEYPRGQDFSDDKVRRSYAQYARATWDEMEEVMRPLRQVWTQNLLFLSGRQWWKTLRSGAFIPIEAPEWHEHPVSNLCIAFFRTFLAKATKIRPAWAVMPASTDPEDIKATQLAEEVLEAKWVELKLGEAIRRAVAWTIATGNCFIYPYWNTQTGRIKRLEVEEDVPEFDDDGNVIGYQTVMVPLDEDGEPYLKEDGSYDLDKDPHIVDEGEVGVKVYSPYQVRVNPEAETEDEVRYMNIAEAMSLREIAIRYPEHASKVRAEDVTTLEREESMMSSVLGGVTPNLAPSRTTPPGSHNESDNFLQKALVIHHHERPSVDYPNGRYWISAGDVLLTDPDDLPEGIWPALIHMTDVIVPGRYHAAAVMENIVSLNREYNEINAQIKEHHNLMAKGKWLVPKGSGIKRGKITNQPGEVIEFNQGFEPRQAEMTSLPAAVYGERERVMNDFEMVSGLHKVSMGRPPPGVTAGVAFLQLQEADDTDLGPFLAKLEEVVAQLAGDVLEIIKARYHDERLFYVTGRNSRYLVKAFRGSDLAGALDVKPVAESSFPWSKTARQSMLLSLASTMPQLFTDPDTGQFDVSKFANLLPIGGLDTLAQNEDLDVQEALREEEIFASYGLDASEVPQVEWWQNHVVHFNQHVRVLKSADFLEWAPEAQDLFKQHVQQTMQARDGKAAQAAQMNAMAQGNAPKELYQQGGPVPPPGAVPPEEAMAEMEQPPVDPGVEGMMNAMPDQPAQQGQFEGATGFDPATGDLLL